MNGKDEIIKRRRYYEGLKQAIAMSMLEESMHEVEEVLQDDETEESFKETLRLWKEVNGPLDGAITFVRNNRFLVEAKEYIINEDSNAVFMKPEEIFNVLKNLLSATVMEFLSVLDMSSTKKTKLLDYVEHGDKDSFALMLEQAQCDLTALTKLCSYCWDALSTGAEMEGDDFTLYLDSMAGHQPLEGDADDRKLHEAIKQLQPSAEVLDDDDSDEALNQYFSDYRHFLETDLATHLHYYWDWYDDFTLKERNLIDPILEHPLAVDLVKQIRKDYEDNLKYVDKELREASHKSDEDPLVEIKDKTATDYNQVIPDSVTTEHRDIIDEFEIGKKYFAHKKRNYSLAHCTIINEGFDAMADEDKANRFKRFIQLLARERCIYPSIIVMRSCAYAMTGYGFNNPFKPVPVFWNREREKVNILLYSLAELK